MSDSGTDLVTLEDVLYVSDRLIPICQYRGRRVGIPFRLLEPGTSIRSPGDRGNVVLARQVAEWMGLVEPRQRR